jgi:hypothetical protein
MMIIIPAAHQGGVGKRTGADVTRRAAARENLMKFNAALAKDGHLLSLDALLPIEKGARVYFSEGKPTVIDGPSIESQGIIGGYWMTNFSSKDEAIAWAKRIPAVDGDIIEIRPVFDPEDFPENVICPVFSESR